MLKTLVPLLILPLLTNCTIYRSDGRNQLENELPKKVADAKEQGSAQDFLLVRCQRLSRLQIWLQEEFPKKNYTLVVSEPDLEIWSGLSEPKVEVHVFQKNETSNQSCQYDFKTVAAWQKHQEQFIFEMRNNLLPIE